MSVQPTLIAVPTPAPTHLALTLAPAGQDMPSTLMVTTAMVRCTKRITNISIRIHEQKLMSQVVQKYTVYLFPLRLTCVRSSLSCIIH